MNEEELKKGCGKKYVHSQGYDICGEHYGDGSVALCPNCSGKLEGFQKGKLKQKKEGLFIMNGSNVDLRICETEAISEDEDEINQIGVIKSGCGLRVYPKDNSIYIEQLQKDIGTEERLILQAIDKGFQKGYTLATEDVLKKMNKIYNDLLIQSEITFDNKSVIFDVKTFNRITEELKASIKNSQTEQNSDKEVAQPYSKSDKTTKEIGGMK